jgi:hypothetical protein
MSEMEEIAMYDHVLNPFWEKSEISPTIYYTTSREMDRGVVF